MFERSISTILTACCVALVGLVARRELTDARAQNSEFGRYESPRRVENWDAVEALGRTLWGDSGQVSIVEFGDFECPACRKFGRTLEQVRAELGDSVTVAFAHFPLSNHRFAYRAALASECAAVQGAFVPLHNLLFEFQDSLGLLSWAGFARRAAIDTSVFVKCMEATTSARIDSGLAMARRLELRGTPAVLIEGWLLHRVPTAEELVSFSREFRHGRVPREFSSRTR